MKKRLHELIEMAERGEKFEANAGSLTIWTSEDFKRKNNWYTDFITAEWTVRMKREPRVIWLAQRADDSLYEQWFESSEDSKHFGKPIKFIEVISEEDT